MQFLHETEFFMLNCSERVSCPFGISGVLGVFIRRWYPAPFTDRLNTFCESSLFSSSNIEKVYTDDPKKNPDAKPVDTMTWKEFRVMVGFDQEGNIVAKGLRGDDLAVKLAELLK